MSVAVCVLLLGAPEAVAQGRATSDVVRAAAEVLGPLVVAESMVDACDRRDPAGRAARKAALEVWRASQPLGPFEEAFRAIRSDRALQALRRSMASTVRDQVYPQVARNPEVCRDAKALFASPTLQLADKIAAFRRLAADHTAAGAPAAPPEVATRRYSLAQISALVLKAMDSAGAKAAERDRAREAARSKAGEAALSRLGPVAVSGRAVRPDRLREWRGERQSTFEIRCRSFADRADKDRMTASKGKDILVAGAVRSVSESRARPEGVITLTACRVLPADDTPPDRGVLPDEDGLMPRPMEPEEAFAGADKGIAPDDVNSVLYQASFTNRMDGFGNGYVDRREDIYVLLDDGTAYLHTWPFPFTDLDVEQSKRREPERWFTWTRGWLRSGVTLTSSTGEAKILDKPQTLKPLPTAAKFRHDYYYLTVASGGARRDRGVSFREDGTLTATRSSFVAAQIGYGGGDVGVSGPGFAYSGGGGGPGFIAAQGPKGEVTGRYAIGPWSLTITAADGSIERRFFARPDDEAETPPDSVIIDGEVHWTKKAKD